MAYKTEELEKTALEAIEKHKLFFIEDVVTLLPISKPTFYDYFPIDSNELNELKKLIEDNKITLKTSMRKKWYDSDNATLQMGLMKLIATPEEHKRLSQTFVDSDNNQQLLA